jgi:hypothetical protein
VPLASSIQLASRRARATGATRPNTAAVSVSAAIASEPIGPTPMSPATAPPSSASPTPRPSAWPSRRHSASP